MKEGGGERARRSELVKRQLRLWMHEHLLGGEEGVRRRLGPGRWREEPVGRWGRHCRKAHGWQGAEHELRRRRCQWC